MKRTVSSADVRERLLAQGIVPVPSTLDEFSRTIHENIARFASVIREFDLKAR